MYRGTIRKVGFSRAWNTFVQLGMTDDTYTIENSENMSSDHNFHADQGRNRLRDTMVLSLPALPSAFQLLKIQKCRISYIPSSPTVHVVIPIPSNNLKLEDFILKNIAIFKLL